MAIGGGGSSGGGGVSSGAIRAGEAFVEARLDDSKFKLSLDGIVKRLQNVGGIIRNIGVNIGGLGSALSTPFAAAIGSAVLYGDSIQDIADRTGSSAEAISRLGFAADLSASSIADVEAGAKLLTKSALAAAEGTKEQADAFKMLGVAPDKFLEMGLDEQFLLISKTLDGMSNSSDKSSLKLALLGKSAFGLGPLLDQGNDKLKQLLERSDKIGQTISTEDAQAAAELKDIFDETLKIVKFGLIEVGKSFFGMTGDIKTVHEGIVDLASQVRQWIKDNRQLIVTVASIVAGITAAGIAITAFGLVISGIGLGITGLVTILGVLKAAVVGTFAFMVSPVGLVVAAVAGLTYAFLELTDSGAEVKASFFDAFNSIKEIAADGIGGIIASLQTGDFTGAWEIAWRTLKAIWLEGTLFLRLQWSDFVNFFGETWGMAVAGYRLMWNEFTSWFQDKAVMIGAFVTKAIFEAYNSASELLKEIGVDIGEVSSGSQVQAIANAQRKLIEQNRVNQKNAIIGEVEGTAAANVEARKNLESSYRGEIDRLRAEISQLSADAKARNNQNTGPAEAKERVRTQQLAKSIAETVRGAFQSQNFSSVFAFGAANTVQQKQLDELEDVNKNLKDIKKGGFLSGVFT